MHTFASLTLRLGLIAFTLNHSVIAAHGLDLNGNEISDVWESLYPIAAAHLERDDDGDGQNNLMEGLAWTNPGDATSHFSVENLSTDLANVSFNWQQMLGLRYRVWKSQDLLDWQRDANSYIGENDTNSVSKTLNTQNFFRLVAERSLNSDTDALTNREEHELGTDPQNWDTDGDKVPDDIEFSLGLDPLSWIDSDNDGLPDDWEQWCILHDLNDAVTELSDIDATTNFDGDTVTDGMEFSLGTSPVKAVRNILFFLTEDQGPDLGVLGTVALDTPQLDALANSGVNFTRAFALSPVCSPSKMALFTGTYPHENSAHRNVRNYGTNFPLVGDPSDLGLGGVHEDLPTLIEVLNDRGWHTAISSKSHVQPIRKFPYDEGFGASVSYPRTAADVTSYINQTVASAGDRPFFLCLNVAAPHLPFRTIAINNGLWDPSGGLLGDGGVTNVDANAVIVPASVPNVPAVRQDFADYYGAIEIIDGHYAAARDALIANGIEGETLVVFTSDHGNGLARFKQSIYGLHVPLLIDGPGVSGGRTLNEPISHLDLMPTFLDFAGIPQMPSLKGKSLLPILAGDAGFADRATILTAAHEKYDARAVTDGQYYYVRTIRQVDSQNNSGNPTGFNFPQAALNADQYVNGQPWYNRSFAAIKADNTTPQYELLRQILEGDLPEEELYDLDVDLWSTNNLAADPAYAAIKAKLRSELTSWRIYTDDYNSDPAEMTRRTARFTPLPGTTTATTETDNFNTGSGNLNGSSKWTTLVFGNAFADYSYSSNGVDSPAGPQPVARYNSSATLEVGKSFTVSVDVGFSSIGVGGGIALGIQPEPDAEYTYWQFLLTDGRSGPATDVDIRVRKLSDSGASTRPWLLTVDNLTNYPNGFSTAPANYFRMQVNGQAGSPLVDLSVLNPDGSVYYTVTDLDLGEPIPAASEFGITSWSSNSCQFDNFELQVN
jgi:N-sulfoglucosamine sulfohydrolase